MRPGLLKLTTGHENDTKIDQLGTDTGNDIKIEHAGPKTTLKLPHLALKMTLKLTSLETTLEMTFRVLGFRVPIIFCNDPVCSCRRMRSPYLNRDSSRDAQFKV